MFYLKVIWYGILDLLLALVVFVPMRLIKIFKHEPFDHWLYTEKNNSPIAIVLVHGSGVNEAQFIPARNILPTLTNARVYSCDLNYHGNYMSDANETIEKYAARLEYYIRNNVLSVRTEKLILIGHSMGGLVAGFLVDRLPVDVLVSVGTPWQGAAALKYVLGYPGFNTERHKQMAPGSSFLRNCKEKISKSNVKVFSIGCNYDFQVLEQDAHLYINNEVLGVVESGHIAAIVLRSMWKQIVQEI